MDERIHAARGDIRILFKIKLCIEVWTWIAALSRAVFDVMACDIDRAYRAGPGKFGDTRLDPVGASYEEAQFSVKRLADFESRAENLAKIPVVICPLVPPRATMASATLRKAARVLRAVAAAYQKRQRQRKSPLLASVCSPPPKGKTISASGDLPTDHRAQNGLGRDLNHPFFTALATSGWKSK